MIKTTRKSLMLLSIVLIVSFALASCQPAPAAPAAEPAAPAAETEAPAAAAPAAETEAPAAAEPAEKPTVKVSFIGPLTGSNAGPGQGGLNSFTLAINQANADPTKKYKYEIVAIDDECKPEVGVQAALKATSDPDIIASASHYCSMVAISTVDTFHNNGMASIVWGAVLPAITYGNDYVEVSRVNGTQIQQNDVNAENAVKWGFKTVSIIHDTSDYGKGHLEYFTQSAKKAGLEILSVQGVTLDQQDFTAELTKIKAEDPDMIYFGGLTDLGVLIRGQMVKLGIKSQFDGTSGIKNESFNEALGPNAEGVTCYLDGAPIEALPGGQEFKAAYEAAGFEQPWEAYGPYAYIAGQIIVDAIEKVGPDRAKVVEEINKTKLDETILGKIEFDDHGQNIVPLVSAYVSQDGKWVPFESSEYATGKRVLPGILHMEERSK